MKFQVSRTRDTKPIDYPGIVDTSVPPLLGPSWPKTYKYELEVNTLEELCAFVKAMKQEVIIDLNWLDSNDPPSLEVYDDYRE